MHQKLRSSWQALGLVALLSTSAPATLGSELSHIQLLQHASFEVAYTQYWAFEFDQPAPANALIYLDGQEHKLSYVDSAHRIVKVAFKGTPKQLVLTAENNQRSWMLEEIAQ